MESFLPSEIGRLIYGYLSEEDTNLAETFLNNSDVMKECRISQAKSRKFNAKVQGLTLTDILDQYSVLCSLIFRNVETTECDPVLDLLQKIVQAKIPELDYLNDNASCNESIVSQEREHPIEVTRKSDNFTQTDPESVQESMDVSSSSLNEPQETINLLNSENEVNSSNLNKSDPDISIDLTSPCSLDKSPRRDFKAKSTKAKNSKVSTKTTKLVEKSEISVPKEKLVEHRTPKKPDDTNHSINNVFNKLSVNPSTRLANYVTPLKPDRKFVFGEHTPYTNNNRERSSDEHISRIFGSALKCLDENPLEFGTTSKTPILSTSNSQEIPTTQETNEFSTSKPNDSLLTSGEPKQCEVVETNCSEPTPVLENEPNSSLSETEMAKTSISSIKPVDTVKPRAKPIPELLSKSPKSRPPMFGIACLSPMELNGKQTEPKKLPWDTNLRQFVPEEMASEKKSKRCKREARKSITEPAAKRHKSDTTPSKCKKSSISPIKCKKISRKNALKEKESILKTPISKHLEAKEKQKPVEKTKPNSLEAKKTTYTKCKVSAPRISPSYMETKEAEKSVQNSKTMEDKRSTQEAPMTNGPRVIDVASERIESETLNESSDYFIPNIGLGEPMDLYKAFIVDDDSPN